jgi:hypothetical protein
VVRSRSCFAIDVCSIRLFSVRFIRLVADVFSHERSCESDMVLTIIKKIHDSAPAVEFEAGAHECYIQSQPVRFILLWCARV